MEPFQYHIFICNQHKPEGIPSCPAAGAGKVIDALRAEIAKQQMTDRVQITTCGSLGLCRWGPNMIVYPDEVWYCGLTPSDIPEIVSEHLQGGKPVARLVKDDAKEVRAEIDANIKRRQAAENAMDKSGALPIDFQQTIRGFQPSRVILTAIELDVFTHVGDGCTAKSVAGKIETDPRATGMLLNALVALELLQKNGDTFTCGSMARRYLMEGSPDDSRAAMMHTVHLWDRWGTLTDCVREGTSVSRQSLEERDEEWTRAFIAAMHKNASFRGKQVANAVGVNDAKRMLDVGGGSGAYAMAFVDLSDDLHADIFDLDSVIPLAKDYVEEAGLSDRISFKTGDMLEDDLGSGYDIVLLSAICHMFSEDDNLKLLQKIHGSLNPGGRLVIQDFILESDKTAPYTGALFALNMLVATREGNSYSEDEYFEWLNQTGFEQPKHIDLTGPTGLIVGVKS